MAMTQAKIGRLMKKRDMPAAPTRPGRRRSARRLVEGRALGELADVAGGIVHRHLGRRHLLAAAHQLDALDNDPVAVGDPGVDQPVVADAALHREHALDDLAVAADEAGGGLALDVVADRPLRHQEAVLRQADLEDGAGSTCRAGAAGRDWRTRPAR